jgi:hypothetical protein
MYANSSQNQTDNNENYPKDQENRDYEICHDACVWITPSSHKVEPKKKQEKKKGRSSDYHTDNADPVYN